MNVAIVAVMQAIAGALGGGFVAGAIDDFGGRILSNLVVGGIGSFLLNGQIPALVNGGGEPNIDASGGDDLALRVLAGLIAGGLLALIFNLRDLFKHKQINNK